MAKEINAGNLDALCRGSSFLGSGGGGEPDYLRSPVERALTQWAPVSLVTLDDLDDEDCIADHETGASSVSRDCCILANPSRNLVVCRSNAK